jgi:hypothetical protein
MAFNKGDLVQYTWGVGRRDKTITPLMILDTLPPPPYFTSKGKYVFWNNSDGKRIKHKDITHYKALRMECGSVIEILVPDNTDTFIFSYEGEDPVVQHYQLDT